MVPMRDTSIHTINEIKISNEESHGFCQRRARPVTIHQGFGRAQITAEQDSLVEARVMDVDFWEESGPAFTNANLSPGITNGKHTMLEFGQLTQNNLSGIACPEASFFARVY